jgi:hypothetical protein
MAAMIVPTILLHFLHPWRSEVPATPENLTADRDHHAISVASYEVLCGVRAAIDML